MDTRRKTTVFRWATQSRGQSIWIRNMKLFLSSPSRLNKEEEKGNLLCAMRARKELKKSSIAEDFSFCTHCEGEEDECVVGDPTRSPTNIWDFQFESLWKKVSKLCLLTRLSSLGNFEFYPIRLLFFCESNMSFDMRWKICKNEKITILFFVKYVYQGRTQQSKAAAAVNGKKMFRPKVSSLCYYHMDGILASLHPIDPRFPLDYSKGWEKMRIYIESAAKSVGIAK